MVQSVKRRDLLMGGILSLGGITAWTAKSSVEGRSGQLPDIAGMLPETFGPWSALVATDPILPPRDALSDATYDNVVARRYTEGQTPITLVAAYSGAQTWTAQVHRPEICYPASGFSIVDQQNETVSIGTGSLSGRRLLARRGQREDTVFYWTRIARSYPLSLSDQRQLLIKAIVSGDVLDGIVVRISMTNPVNSAKRSGVLQGFAAALYSSLSDDARALIYGPLT